MVSGKFNQLNQGSVQSNTDSFIKVSIILKVTKAALDDFRPGRGLPCCVLEARPLCEDFPQLLYQIILNGIKPPHHKVILSYMPSIMTRGTVNLS